MSLEREIEELERRLSRIESRPALVVPPPGAHLARTAKDPRTGLYPLEKDRPEIYPIIFVDASFTPDSLTKRDRQPEARTVARNLEPDAAYIPEGTLLIVIPANGCWWFERS
jgi:hypothetical protein